MGEYLYNSGVGKYFLSRTQGRKRYLQYRDLIQGLYPEYTENSYKLL